MLGRGRNGQNITKLVELELILENSLNEFKEIYYTGKIHRRIYSYNGIFKIENKNIKLICVPHPNECISNEIREVLWRNACSILK